VIVGSSDQVIRPASRDCSCSFVRGVTDLGQFSPATSAGSGKASIEGALHIMVYNVGTGGS
jgi:hypothetical protein